MDIFPGPTALLKALCLLNFLILPRVYRYFQVLWGFCNINFHILFMPYIYSRPYVYSFCQIFPVLRLFPALHLFHSLEYSENQLWRISILFRLIVVKHFRNLQQWNVTLFLGHAVHGRRVGNTYEKKPPQHCTAWNSTNGRWCKVRHNGPIYVQKANLYHNFYIYAFETRQFYAYIWMK